MILSMLWEFPIEQQSIGKRNFSGLHQKSLRMNYMMAILIYQEWESVYRIRFNEAEEFVSLYINRFEAKQQNKRYSSRNFRMIIQMY